MELTVRNNRGLTIIELMIALVILQISLLGLLAAITNNISANLDNELRNASIRLTTQTAEAIQSLAFNDNWVADTTGTGVPHSRVLGDADQDLKGFPVPVVNIRGFQQTYVISWTVAELSGNLKQVGINVSYADPQGIAYSNDAAIYKHRTL